MFDQQIFDAEGDGSQDVNTLFSLSGEFLAAAQVLLAAPRGRVGYSSATYYLLGHSAELMLKAFLCKHGQTINDLRKLNHDLRKLAARARDAGLPERVPLDQILRLATAYKEKSFEYRRNKNQTFPSLDLLTEEVDSLQVAVFDQLLRECDP